MNDVPFDPPPGSWLILGVTLDGPVRADGRKYYKSREEAVANLRRQIEAGVCRTKTMVVQVDHQYWPRTQIRIGSNDPKEGL